MLISIVLMLSLFLMGRTNMVSASDVKGSIAIDYHVTLDQEEKIYPSGVQFAVYQIGYLRDGEIVLNEEFQSSGVSLQDGDASARNRQAKQLYAYARQNGSAGTIAETKDGKIKVENVDIGIYLIAQTKQYNFEKRYWFDSEPFLLSVPLEINGEWTYQVRVEPKTAWTPINQPDEPTPTTPDNNTTGGHAPHTGDDTHILWWFVAMLTSAAVLVSLKKREKENLR